MPKTEGSFWTYSAPLLDSLTPLVNIVPKKAAYPAILNMAWTRDPSMFSEPKITVRVSDGEIFAETHFLMREAKGWPEDTILFPPHAIIQRLKLIENNQKIKVSLISNLDKHTVRKANLPVNDPDFERGNTTAYVTREILTYKLKFQEIGSKSYFTVDAEFSTPFWHEKRFHDSDRIASFRPYTYEEQLLSITDFCADSKFDHRLSHVFFEYADRFTMFGTDRFTLFHAAITGIKHVKGRFTWAVSANLLKKAMAIYSVDTKTEVSFDFFEDWLVLKGRYFNCYVPCAIDHQAPNIQSTLNDLNKYTHCVSMQYREFKNRLLPFLKLWKDDDSALYWLCIGDGKISLLGHTDYGDFANQRIVKQQEGINLPELFFVLGYKPLTKFTRINYPNDKNIHIHGIGEKQPIFITPEKGAEKRDWIAAVMPMIVQNKYGYDTLTPQTLRLFVELNKDSSNGTDQVDND